MNSEETRPSHSWSHAVYIHTEIQSQRGGRYYANSSFRVLSLTHTYITKAPTFVRIYVYTYIYIFNGSSWPFYSSTNVCRVTPGERVARASVKWGMGKWETWIRDEKE